MDSMIAFFVGALVPTLGLSRLAFIFMRSWKDGGVPRILLANGISLLVVTLLGGMGLADGGAFAAPQAFASYVLPQAVWLVFDLLRHYRRRRAENENPLAARSS
jgi:hypothetical protein